MAHLHDFFGGPILLSNQAETTGHSTSKIIASYDIVGSKIFDFFSLSDLLKWSVCSRSTAGSIVAKEVLDRVISSHPRTRYIGFFQLSFIGDLSAGLLRRTLSRVTGGHHGVLSIDSSTGRVMLDIGSAFNNQDTFFASAVALPLSPSLRFGDDGISETGSDCGIRKDLEIASYDEYDDFAPRHPAPRAKTHNRGDSYFNSDVESIAQEALSSMDLGSIASLAMNLEKMDVPSTGRGRPGTRGHRRPPTQVLSPTTLTPENLQNIAQEALTGDSENQ